MRLTSPSLLAHARIPLLAGLAASLLALPAHAQVSLTSATSDDANVYYAISFTGTATFRHVYIDVDRSAATGYRTGGIGADFLIENNILFAYAGTGSDWTWKKVTTTLANTATATTATWTVPMALLNYPTTVYARPEITPPAVAGAVVTQVVRSRVALQQPFASDSIWNTPIGSGAVYVPAHLAASWPGNGWDSMPQADLDYIFLAPNAPPTAVYAQTDSWSTSANRCLHSSTVLATVPIPADWLLPNAAIINNNGNDSTAVLLSDGHTLVQMQPIARCAAGAAFTAELLYGPPVDLYGPGIIGAHGGSGMSSIGGSLRVGELRPGGHAPRHALKIDLYSAEVLARCAATAASPCNRWPAPKYDHLAPDATLGYGTVPNVNNTNTAMRMGALLAIPASVDIGQLGLETDPGRQLAWTLQNYGAYIVDSRGGHGFTIATAEGTDGSKIAEFQGDYGFAFQDYALHAGASPWVRDMQRLVTALAVVDNNSPTSIGGGGTPLQPLAPPIVAPAAP